MSLNLQERNNNMKFSRRDFTKMILGGAAVGLVEGSTMAKVFGQTKRSMSWLSAQSASGEGLWTNLKIEGKLSKDLHGTLFRTAPGLSENFSTPLNHLFDGDAFLSSWKFENGKASLRARFLPTPPRIEEQEAKQMLYGEYGTHAPKSDHKLKYNGKNNPSVNVIEWRGKLLGLSEGGLPSVINPTNFDYEGLSDFGGVVPNFLTFTAHPRVDSKTGNLFAYGFEKRPPGNLHVYEMNRQDGSAKLLYKSPMDGFYMVHDSILTENYFILLIPPVEYNVQAMMQGKMMSEAVGYNDKKPTRLLAFPRNNQNGTAKPIQVELPPQFFFHFGNAFEDANGNLVFEMISGDNKMILNRLSNWKKNPYNTDVSKTWDSLRRITVDLKAQKVVSNNEFIQNVEFPRYDMRLTGKNARYLYVTENGYDPEAKIIRVDLHKGNAIKTKGVKNHTFGEPVFVPKTSQINEERGWILAQGYDSDKNESFLEILDAQTLEFETRIWASNQHFPLGFHGNFYNSI